MIESSKLSSSQGVLRYGMVGGGAGAFIGDVHRKTAAFDGKCALAAGAFSRDFDVTKQTGIELGLDEDRLYPDFAAMAEKEAAREDGIDFAVIAAPNYIHFEAAKAFLESGIHVVCEKPFTFTLEQAIDLKRIAENKGLLLCVMYSYSGYPMLRQARAMARAGEIGEVLMVMGEYPQDWLIEVIEGEQRQAAWRTDQAMAGVSNCTGDIGSHIENTAAFVTGLKIKRLLARLDIVGQGRTLDTNSAVLLEYESGATGMYWSSQVAIGNDNALTLRVYGTKGSIEWEQEYPNVLRFTRAGEPTRTLNRGHGYLHPAAASRLPSGHSEGYHEAFANIYSRFADALLKLQSGEALTAEELDFPNADDGIEGVKFIHACVESSKKDSQWVEL
ncbi:MAG: Gfo/Idh/MocA family oxidoreductase [Oscillospiraceae bacterium]|nr:Gfo/Idh/MocA family oxidoreductase [Oscillospiraceae bacterium]